MKRLKHLLIMVSLVSFAALGIASAYEPAVQWQKTLGTSRSDVGYSIRQTSDDGYIIAGTTYSFGAGWLDVYLIKTDSAGNLQWQETFGGNDFDWGYSVQQTSDGGYVITGTTCSFGDPLGDVYLIKTDPNGNLLWQKTFGGSSDDYGSSVQQTSDDGYIIAGATGSFGDPIGDVYLIKTDPNGNTLWQNTFGGSGAEYGYSVQQTSDGGYIIAGRTYSFGAKYIDVYLIKTNSAGNLLWQKTFGGNSKDEGYSVQQTTDGGFIIAGMSYSNARGPDIYLIKTDPNGNQEWQKTFGGSYTDLGFSVQQTSDGGFIIAGWTYSFGAVEEDVYLIKTDSAGNFLWQKTFGGSKGDGAYSVQKTSDGGYIIAGVTESFGAGGQVYLIKLSAEFCKYALLGDVNSDCKFDFYDFAIMSANWLIDCNINPADPSCIPK